MARERRSQATGARAARAGLAVTASAVLTAACGGAGVSSDAPVVDTQAAAAYVGSESCVGCHAQEGESWAGSHHDWAMRPADAESVRGDFSGAEFRYNGITTTFLERDGGYFVRTDGADGTLSEFRIAYTYGIEPLQQYLVEFPGGRLQPLGIAWDSRALGAGRGRWFHLYPGQAVDYRDPLHWTSSIQTWNTMCADCHSTNVAKNYDVVNDRFATAWSVINVGCEACHGPGSRHSGAPGENRLELEPSVHAWQFGASEPIARRVGPTAKNELHTCARCHSRRAQLREGFEPGEDFLDAYRPELLGSGLYHADGQVLDEVYVYGSFLQSAMHAAGVTCSDCHDPHSLELRSEGDALCAGCHSPTVFAAETHHRHPGRTVSCVDCHMRAETFMVVDERRDHSFRVPRPDLSVELGTPNACNDCHAERTAAWARDIVAEWYPDGRHGEFHFGAALAAGRRWSADRGPLLRRVVADRTQPPIVRATAIELLAEQIDGDGLDLLDSVLEDDVPLVQLAAIDALSGLNPSMIVDRAQRFLDHPLLALRIAAARVLAPARQALSERREPDLDAAAAEALAAFSLASDRLGGELLFAGMLTSLGRRDEAEAALERARQRFPDRAPAYVNLADLLRLERRDAEAEQLLTEALARIPGDADLSFSLGLTLVRMSRLEEAVSLLEAASRSSPDNPYYQYVYGVALNSAGRVAESLEVLNAAHERFPGYRNVLVALATILRDAGDIEGALRFARDLLALSPADAEARSLLAELESPSPR